MEDELLPNITKKLVEILCGSQSFVDFISQLQSSHILTNKLTIKRFLWGAQKETKLTLIINKSNYVKLKDYILVSSIKLSSGVRYMRTSFRVTFEAKAMDSKYPQTQYNPTRIWWGKSPLIRFQVGFRYNLNNIKRW